MDNQSKHLETLTEIRSLMERSSRFISLSGLSGVFAGVFALIGVAVAYIYLDLSKGTQEYYKYAFDINGDVNLRFNSFLFTDAICVLIASLLIGTILTTRKAKKKDLPVWDATAKRLLVNMLIPLAAGGIFCLIMLYHGLIEFIAPSTLLFYGLSLLNASKYTLNDIRYLGICEIILGLISSVYLEYGLLFWALGFGVLHIVYGSVMYYKYEK